MRLIERFWPIRRPIIQESVPDRAITKLVIRGKTERIIGADPRERMRLALGLPLTVAANVERLWKADRKII